MIDVSILIPVKDEAENILSVAAEVTAAMSVHSWSWECLWVDDGSADSSPAVLRQLAESDVRHRYLSLETNTGQSAALWAGFKEAGGKILAIFLVSWRWSFPERRIWQTATA